MRRVVALVLPHLACELASRDSRERRPLGVILVREGAEVGELKATAVLDAVNEEARRYGVRAGMKVTEASAIASGLRVERVTRAALEAELGRVAELAMGLAPTASIQLELGDEEEASSLDTVWLDVTGAAHLVGGEEALADELVERAGALGHAGKAAIAEGPIVAQALARYAPSQRAIVVPPGGSAEALARLPVSALPIASETASWFLRLGLVTIGDLARVPRPALAARLAPKSGTRAAGTRAPRVMELMAGRDPTPLLPYVPPRVLVEEQLFEEGVENVEALLFVLRGMTSRIGARLGGRGEACARLEMEIALDGSIAALREVAASVELAVDLPAPLAGEADLLRALRARLERVELAAPAIGVRLVVPAIARARRVQLDLSRGTAVNPDALPALLAELSAEIGAARVGVLTLVDAHAPERRSGLAPVDFSMNQAELRKAWRKNEERVSALQDDPLARVTRLLPAPVPLGDYGMQRVVAIDQALYAAESKRFLFRLAEVGWWTAQPIQRDYLSTWFTSGDPMRRRPGMPPLAGEGLVYVDRTTGDGFLQGWIE